MDNQEVLQQVGLSDGESKVYLALLKLGSSPVNKIKEETRLHRTTIYDFIEKLLNKGLVSFVIKSGVRYYNAAHPNKLLDFIKEKEDSIRDIIPGLIKLNEIKKEYINVEVYKGKEGFKTILNLIINEKKELLGIGIDESMFEAVFPYEIKQYFRKEKLAGIKERMITFEGAKFVYKHSSIKYKRLPKEYFNPTPIFTFGDYICVIIWEPLTVISIKNENVADSYRKQFELLWKIAKQ
ncbi:hypothetical protein HYT57_00625 [Candidatus Woesearchaeota archaeon]|nr:hypothetical protein [Candidatus Woesearchaeota archaeon]